MTHYIPNVDLVNDNMHTKVGLNPSIRSQDIKPKPNYDGMAERLTEWQNNRMTDRANPV